MKVLRLAGKAILLFILVTVIVSSIYAYKVEEKQEVHQHIAKEAIKILRDIPKEISNHSSNSIKTNIKDVDQLDRHSYDAKDDIIDGSGEEDIAGGAPFLFHFWQPDNPSSGWYGDGLGPLASSWLRANNVLEEDDGDVN